MRVRRNVSVVCAFAMVAVGLAATFSVSASASPSVAPIITTQPDIGVVSQTGDAVSFVAGASGVPAPTVQWQSAPQRTGNWTNVGGATDPTLTVVATNSNLGDAYRAVFTDAAGVAISRPAKLVSRTNWMRDLGDDIADVPLSELTIPGSHDMGTYGITDSSGNSLDQQLPVDCGSFDIEGLCENYAKAEDQDATHELDGGIRYFDLRVCGERPDGVVNLPENWSQFSLVTCHGLVAAPLQDILDQTRDWVDAHPGEVVILDLNHHFQLDPDTEATDIENTLGTRMIKPVNCIPNDPTSGTCAGNLTLRTIRDQHLGSIIVNFENDGAPGDTNTTFTCCPEQENVFHIQPELNAAFYDRHPDLWGRKDSTPVTSDGGRCTLGASFASCYGNDDDIGSVLDTVRTQTNNRSSNPGSNRFYVQFLQTTPGSVFIAENLSEGLESMAIGDAGIPGSNPTIEPAFFTCDSPSDTCFGEKRPENLNILAVNFYEVTDFHIYHSIICAVDTCGQGLTPLEQLVLQCSPSILDSSFDVCTYYDLFHFDFVQQVLRFDEYARTYPVVSVGSPTAPASTGWYNAATLGGAGNKLHMTTEADNYRYPTGIAELDCADNSAVLDTQATTTGATSMAGAADLGDGVHDVNCAAADAASQGFHEGDGDGDGPGSTQMPAEFKIDTVPPVVHCPTAARSQLLLNQPITTLSGTVTDSGSGPATSTVNGSVSTAKVGTFTTQLTGSDVAGNAASISCSYTVSYRIVYLYNTIAPTNSGASVPIRIELADYFGNDVSAANITVTAKSVTNTVTNATLKPTSPGATNPLMTFVVSPTHGYLYVLKSTGYAKGNYSLDFSAGADPLSYHAPFVIG
jgi:hypothetical protein